MTVFILCVLVIIFSGTRIGSEWQDTDGSLVSMFADFVVIVLAANVLAGFLK